MKLPATTKSLLHLPTRTKTGTIIGLRYFSGELDDPHKPLPPPQPVSEIVSLLNTTDHNDWNSKPQLVEFLHTPPFPTSLLKITRQLGSTEKALQFFEFFKSHSSSSSSSPSSLSFTFQAILEQAMREEISDVPSKLYQLFSFAKDREIPLSINAATLLIRCFGRAKMLEESIAVFNALDPESRNTNVVNLLLDCLFRGGNIDDGFKVLDEMLDRDSSFPPNESTMDIILSAIWKRNWVGRRMSVEEICGLVVRFFEHGVFLDDVWLTKLITNFCRSGKCNKAWDLLHDMMRLGGQAEAVSFNALLSGLGRERDFEKMNLLMNEMKGKEIKPDVVTFGILINHLCKSYKVDEAMQVFEKMGGSESDGILVKPDLVLYNTLIDGLCKVGRQEEGFKLMEKMRLESGYEPNTVTYNCLIDGFCKAGEIERSYELFDQMKKGGVVPNVITLNTLLDGMCKHGKPDRYTYNTLISYFSQKEQFATAHRVMKRMIDDGYLPNVVTYGALIHAYCLAGNVDEAMKIFQNMSSSTNVPPNTVIYNTLIDALCKSDKVEAGISLLGDMKDKGVRPNTITYNAIFKGLQERNWVEKAFQIMDQMTENACNPDYITMEVLTQWLSAIGETEKLRSFLEGYEVSTSTA
nr:pentatricopeptide repeat-containing protein At3g61520, mitochondrial-like isoform X2 [Nicotiana tomentosiformis]